MAQKLAVVTGASSGIGLELARLAARDGHDLILAADRPLAEAVREFEGQSRKVTHVEADLSTREGVRKVIDAVGSRDVDLLFLNAGHGEGGSFMDQHFDTWRHVLDTNVTGTLDLYGQLGKRMVEAGRGRILFTGSIAGVQPGAFHAVYNGTKAFIDSFAIAQRNELKDSGVTITVLMPGATETEFFDRAHMKNTKVGAAKKQDAASVAKTGYKALLAGRSEVVAGFKNKVQAGLSRVLPDTTVAEVHRGMAEPGSNRPRSKKRRASAALPVLALAAGVGATLLVRNRANSSRLNPARSTRPLGEPSYPVSDATVTSV